MRTHQADPTKIVRMPHNRWIMGRFPEDARQAIELAWLENPEAPQISNALQKVAHDMGLFDRRFLDASVIRMARPRGHYLNSNPIDMKVHSQRGNATRWHGGDAHAASRRQDSALAARDGGWTLKAIKEMLGYASESAVHYAIRAAAKRSPCHSREGKLKI
jgi:hypothetical protein